MSKFGWISETQDLPRRWDLREIGWCLVDCLPERVGSGNRTCPLLCDYQAMSAVGLTELRAHRRRILLLGVEGSLERAGLLAAQYADALPAKIALDELAERTARVVAQAESMPRYRNAGPVTLDLFHRDARVDKRWLGLHPREFALLWHLAGRPGERITRHELLSDVWRLQHEPETNRVEVHVSRLRGKLAVAGLKEIVATDPRGGYQLDLVKGQGSAIPMPSGTSQLDAHVRRPAGNDSDQGRGGHDLTR